MLLNRLLPLIFAGVLVAGPSRAESELGVEGEFVAPLGEDDVDSGASVGLRYGPRLDLKLLVLTPELAAEIAGFSGALEPSVYRAVAGARVGVGSVVRPGAFAHVGIGHVNYSEDAAVARSNLTNLTMDAGLTVDFTLLPIVNLGLQGAYKVVAGNGDEPAFSYLAGGAHVAFIF